MASASAALAVTPTAVPTALFSATVLLALSLSAVAANATLYKLVAVTDVGKWARASSAVTMVVPTANTVVRSVLADSDVALVTPSLVASAVMPLVRMPSLSKLCKKRAMTCTSAPLVTVRATPAMSCGSTRPSVGKVVIDPTVTEPTLKVTAPLLVS